MEVADRDSGQDYDTGGVRRGMRLQRSERELDISSTVELEYYLL